MLSPSNLLSLALLYICLLFAVAWFTDHNSDTGAARRGAHWRAWVYALSITVYCSSWTFYGAVGSATDLPWSHAPIYLGPILAFTLCWPVIQRLLDVGERHRVTSIADYIGARYGKRQSLAVIVTLVAAAAVLPYIALQFKALAQAWTTIGGGEVEAVGGDTALLTAIILAVFTILFGTRRLDGRERHQGVMTAIAVESVVKLLAFCAVAGLALVYLVKLPDHQAPLAIQPSPWRLPLTPDFFAQTLIAALAILCLPRQFHAMVVESQGDRHVGVARWLFPLYLLLFMVLVVPISQAGSYVFAVSETMNPDTYVQLLPIALDAPWIAVAAFIGGISAATGMVIVATVALAIMITNEVVAPLVMRSSAGSPSAVLKLGDSLRRIRQLTIAGIMLAAWLVARWIMEIPWLTQIGFICFLAAAQLAPPLLAGLYWRRAHGRAVLVGLSLGILTWFYSAVLPAVLPDSHGLLLSGPLGVAWLAPLNMFGFESEFRLAYATAISLGLNTVSLVLFSFLLRPSSADQRQVKLFMEAAHGGSGADFSPSLIRVSQLQALLPPFVEEAELRRMWEAFEDTYQQRLLPADRAPRFVVERVEAVLAAMIGATSAHQAMEQLENAQQLAYSDLAGMVSDASRLNTFNRELLQTTVESLLQGVAVVDSDLRLVAWNKRYEEMFDYPPRFLYVGCPIERVYRFNAERGILGSSGLPVEQEIAKRLAWLREGNPHRLERTLPNGKVIDIRGTPMPHGGFVTTYIDITDYREVVAQLEEAKVELEEKLASGSQSLSETNAALRRENRLRASVESQLRDANQSKTRFMSATSHDLLQPINAARLFTSVLQARLGDGVDEDVSQTVAQIDGSLRRAEQLISELREIARLDSGRELAKPTDFCAGELLAELGAEFAPVAAAKGLELRVVPSSVWLHTDRSLLYRILQNLLGNALNYTERGGVLVGLRRRGRAPVLQVLDTGPGIAEADQVRIFQEFERLPRLNADVEEGLGLGLAIVKRYADLLELPLGLRSEEGVGTCFSVTVPLGQPRHQPADRESPATRALEGLSLVCLDNDARIRRGMGELLDTLGADVVTVASGWELRKLLESGARPGLVLADYHLDADENGVDAVQTAWRDYGCDAPCIVISADNSAEIRDRVAAAGFRFLPKPVQPDRLQALIAALVDRPAA